MKRKLIFILFAWIAIAGISAFLPHVELLHYIETKSFDMRMKKYSQNLDVSPDIVLIAIDEESIQHYAENKIYWPWPRDFYAKIIRYLHQSGAKVIVFDILLDQPDVHCYGQENDALFASAIHDAGNVVLATHLQESNNFFSYGNRLSYKREITINPNGMETKVREFSNAILPLTEFQRGASLLGSVNFEVDTEDGIARSLSPLASYNGTVIPQLSFSAFMQIHNTDTLTYEKSAFTSFFYDVQGVNVRDVKIPLDEEGKFLLTWYGGKNPGKEFPYFSFANVMSQALKANTETAVHDSSSSFQGKIVIIGSTAAGLADFAYSPILEERIFPKMEFHAIFLGNLLQNYFLYRADSSKSFWMAMTLCLLLCVATLLIRYYSLSIILTGIFMIGWYWLSVYVLNEHRIWLNIVFSETSLFFSFGLCSMVRMWHFRKTKETKANPEDVH